MTKTLYITHPDGVISFRSERRAGEVRIPNYVYDLWTPILGIAGLGLYAIYCRLEREGVTKGLSTRRLAKLARIGTTKLFELNALLQKYGFISIKQPPKYLKIKHFTSEITVKDPPATIDFTKIDADDLPVGGYEVLAPWLLDTAILSGIADDLEQDRLDCNPLKIESGGNDSSFSAPIGDRPF